MKEQIRGFNKAYKKAKKLGFENYFCIPHTTWKEAKEKFDKGMTLKDAIYIIMLQQNISRVIFTKENKLPYCKSCGQLFNIQEFVSGFENCEYCDRNPNKDDLKKMINAKLSQKGK